MPQQNLRNCSRFSKPIRRCERVSVTPTQAFRTLGIAKTTEVPVIRRAYAEKLKAMDIDRDVDGYARLRNARDAALRWARMQTTDAQDTFDPLASVEMQDGTPPDEEKPEAASWLYSAPQAQGTSEPTLTTLLGQSTPSLDVTPGFAAAKAPAAKAIAVGHDPFTRPVLLGLEQNADAVMPAWAHEQALRRLLLPEDIDDELPPLEGWEEAMARGHLKAVLHSAESVSVTAFDEIENWLARMLCDSWPRSAPLLEPAAQVFGWESERGQVSERPAVAYLNSRLRGLRFVEKVQVAGHPLHKAWTELTTPAHQGSRRGWLVKRGDVEQLLEGVRKNFPELEHHFDPWRVALWEKKGTSSDNHGWFSNWRLVIIGVVFLIQVVRFAVATNDADPAPQPVSASEQARENAIVDHAVTTIFGSGVTLEQVRSRQPDLAALFAANRTIARSENSSDAAYLSKVHDLVRERMYISARMQKGALLDDVQRVRIGLLRAAREAGPAQCMAFVRTFRFPAEAPIPLPVVERERKLALRMLDAQQLGPPAQIKNGQTSVSGTIIRKVIDATGIGEDRVRIAMGNKGSDADRCAVTIALIDAALDAPDADRQAILSVM